MPQSLQPGSAVVRTLFAFSGNVCAFVDPDSGVGCESTLTDPNWTQSLGQVCFIRGNRSGAARYDPRMTDEERNSFDNLILLCPKHHEWIDRREPKRFTVEVLSAMKARSMLVNVDTPVVESSVPEEPLVAIADIDGQMRIIELDADGSYQFVDPNAGLHSLLYVTSFETDEFALAIEELEALLNTDLSGELDFQRFFERYPNFITSDEYVAAYPHVVLTRDDGQTLIPDFVLEPVGRGRLCDLLELKLPSESVVVGPPGRARLSAAVSSAYAQLRQYREHFNEVAHRDAVRREYGLEVFYPAMYVVIGRRGLALAEDVRRAEESFPLLHIRTYDDLVDRARLRHARWQRRSI
jgi:hypothetical protein